MTINRNLFVRKLAAQMKEWDKQITQLKAKADTVKAESKVKYDAKIEFLKQKRDLTRTILQELVVPGEEAWADLKVGAEKAWIEVKKAFHKTNAKFK